MTALAPEKTASFLPASEICEDRLVGTYVTFVAENGVFTNTSPQASRNRPHDLSLGIESVCQDLARGNERRGEAALRRVAGELRNAEGTDDLSDIERRCQYRKLGIVANMLLERNQREVVFRTQSDVARYVSWSVTLVREPGLVWEDLQLGLLSLANLAGGLAVRQALVLPGLYHHDRGANTPGTGWRHSDLVLLHDAHDLRTDRSIHGGPVVVPGAVEIQTKTACLNAGDCKGSIEGMRQRYRYSSSVALTSRECDYADLNITQIRQTLRYMTTPYEHASVMQTDTALAEGVRCSVGLAHEIIACLPSRMGGHDVGFVSSCYNKAML